MKISLYTLGCKLNQAETDELKKSLIKANFSVVPFDSGEDIAIIRACGVTCGASQRTRQMIRRVKRKGVYVIATGCLEDKKMPEIDFIGKNNEDVFSKITSLAGFNSLNKGVEKVVGCKLERKTRLRLKIQNGCNFNCAYCIIPFFRGRSEIIPMEEIIRKVKSASEAGYKEVILTGVNICQYNDNGMFLSDLLKKVLDKTKIERIRLGSTDPRLITDKLIEVYNNSPLLPHMHLSLQSGSNTVLQKMNRSYTAEKYFKIVQKFRKINPYFSFTTDIIVGFPGETDDEFRQTCEFVRKIGFTKVHVFPYSSRPGTTAAKMKKQIPADTKKTRVNKLIKLSKQVGQEFASKLIGKQRPVLFEGKREGYWEGYTPEYVRIKINSKKNLENKIIMVKLEKDNIIF
ncbi:MAG: tRNA (N(6)-L-threonylcarbamoyladenosine(37)-C(2))-methylthiotransferase MtaB [Candidatus Magasanikbacteria bacterium]|nr:tRNA (N(6)-L-threonylcarbamoyladenosine(37)-C(2))-methylthiotransferase MtaB [Candidatus Magasanikbacteria bacterium]